MTKKRKHDDEAPDAATAGDEDGGGAGVDLEDDGDGGRPAKEPAGSIPRGWASMDTATKISALSGMSIRALRDIFLEATGGAAPDDKGDREWLRVVSAYAIERKERGCLSETATARLASLEALGPHGPGMSYMPTDRGWRRVDGGTTGRTAAAGAKAAPKAKAASDLDKRLPAPGTVMTATYKGTEVKATMIEDGRVKIGRETFASVSAAAKSVTGKPTSGYAFFKLG